LDAQVDVIALSFVQSPKDVIDARKLIQTNANILIKIEKPSAINSLDNIVALADAVMVARGDLGVELPPEQVPIIQRRVIRKCRSAGKPVIVATHMLESMIEAPTPTRAEASDVATAVYQGTDAVMLSAESAVGRHPKTAVAIMDRIIQAVEADPDHWVFLSRDNNLPEPTSEDAISLSAHQIVDLLKCKAILAFTNTGSTALRMSRERPQTKILGLTPNPRVARQLTLAWGIHSVITEDIASFSEMVTRAEDVAMHEGHVQESQLIVVTAGIPFGRPGTTNTLKIIRLGNK
jgi:pyruvate kinase